VKSRMPLIPEIPVKRLNDVERDQMILEHLKQVESIAKRICRKIPGCIELDDLISAGILGLINAIEKFNPEQGVKLKTFAEHRIRGAILDSLRDLDWAPRDLRHKNRNMQTVCGSLEQRLGRAATDEEKCDAMGINLNELHRLTDCIERMHVGSLETMLYCEDNNITALDNCVADSSGSCPSEAYEKHEMRTIMDAAIDDLPKRERMVVSLYYYEQITMAQIAIIMGVNESRISQVHARAMQRLRMRLHSLHSAA
jgi:RNA polymerase sigma factor FliA